MFDIVTLVAVGIYFFLVGLVGVFGIEAKAGGVICAYAALVAGVICLARAIGYFARKSP